jgi:hypothetical protein
MSSSQSSRFTNYKLQSTDKMRTFPFLPGQTSDLMHQTLVSQILPDPRNPTQIQLESILPEYPSTLPADRSDDTSEDFPAFSFERKSFEGFFDRFNLCAYDSHTLEAIVIYSDSALGTQKSFSDPQVNSNLIRKTEHGGFRSISMKLRRLPAVILKPIGSGRDLDLFVQIVVLLARVSDFCHFHSETTTK